VTREQAFLLAMLPAPAAPWKLDPKILYSSRCAISHPEIGYVGNQWPGDDERCPVCRLLDYIARNAEGK
jgi:hypothetical protein